MFLAVGVAATGARYVWPVLLPAAVVALGFGGLPLTGGYVAKLAVKAPLPSLTCVFISSACGTGQST